MIALGPKDIAKAALFTVLAWAVLHVAERCLTGYLQCRALGCLPGDL